MISSIVWTRRFRPAPCWLVVTAVGRNCYSPVSTLQEKLVNTERLTVTKAIKIVTTYQSVQQSVIMIRDPNMAQVYEIHSRGRARGRDASRSFCGRGEIHRPIPRSASRGF